MSHFALLLVASMNVQAGEAGAFLLEKPELYIESETVHLTTKREGDREQIQNLLASDKNPASIALKNALPEYLETHKKSIEDLIRKRLPADLKLADLSLAVSLRYDYDLDFDGRKVHRSVSQSGVYLTINVKGKNGKVMVGRVGGSAGPLQSDLKTFNEWVYHALSYLRDEGATPNKTANPEGAKTDGYGRRERTLDEGTFAAALPTDAAGNHE